jgi:RNA polymerase sigma-70 factor (sigma-E family)
MQKDAAGTTPDVLARGGTRPAGPGATTATLEIDDLIQDLYQTYATTFVRAAKLLLRDQQSAEDVVQDAFLSLYRALPRLSDHDKVLPYLRTAVMNRARSALRTRRRAAVRQLHQEAQREAQDESSESSAEAAAMAGEDRRAIMTAVGTLPRRAREVLILRYYLDLPDSEIAATLGVSRGTVSSTASRALATLARDLPEEQ